MLRRTAEPLAKGERAGESAADSLDDDTEMERISTFEVATEVSATARSATAMVAHLEIEVDAARLAQAKAADSHSQRSIKELRSTIPRALVDEVGHYQGRIGEIASAQSADARDAIATRMEIIAAVLSTREREMERRGIKGLKEPESRTYWMSSASFYMDVAKLHIGAAQQLAVSQRSFSRRRMQLYALAIDRFKRVAQIDASLRKVRSRVTARGRPQELARFPSDRQLFCRVHDWILQVSKAWIEMLMAGGARRADRGLDTNAVPGSSAVAVVSSMFDADVAISTPEKVTLGQLQELMHTAQLGAAQCPMEDEG